MSEGKLLEDISFNFSFIGELSADAPGVKKINTCIQCGSCSSSCPAKDAGGITHRQLWRLIQMGLDTEAVSSEKYWNCTTCALCDNRCPRGIPLSHIVLKLRELYNTNEELPPAVRQTLSNLELSRNITGDKPENRFLWIENLGISREKISSLFKEKSDAVYYTGCVGALFPQVYKIPQSLTKLLMDMNADFSLLEEEWCCGFPVMASGRGIGAVKEYAQHNIEAIKKKNASVVLVSCPTCHYMFNKIYPMLYDGPLNLKVLHYTEYIGELVRKNGMKFKTDDVTVTYHDPCDLGRKLGITGPPRELINSLPGVKFTEMRFNAEEGKCCGGGGNLEMVNPELSFSIAKNRLEEALSTNAEYLLTCCQQCRRTLQNAARKARARIKVYDFLEFLALRFEATDGGELK